jgi:hypothetical protein
MVQMAPMFDVKKIETTYHHKLPFNIKDCFSKPKIGSESQLLFYKILFSFYQRIHFRKP